MRNFWIELECDGRKTKVATGPRGKDGGFKLKLYMKKHGESLHVYTITGFIYDNLRSNKELQVRIYNEIVKSTASFSSLVK